MTTWWSWWAWCELIGDALYELLLELWQHSEEAAMAMERGFYAEHWRLMDLEDEAFMKADPQWWLP